MSSKYTNLNEVTLDMNAINKKYKKNIHAIAIISFHGFGNPNTRPNLVKDVLERMNIKTTIYFSNFEHIQKQYISQVEDENYCFIKVPTYQKNISLKRLYSYIVFATKLLFTTRLKQEDVLYVCVPCYLSSISALFYKWVFNKKVIIDVVDLWPEALPVKKVSSSLKKYIVSILIPIRNFILLQANLTIFESAYFQELTNIRASNGWVIPLASKLTGTSKDIANFNFWTSHEIRILYLGSVNSIIDIESLVKIVEKVQKFQKVTISIIGGGEKLLYLQEKLDRLKVESKIYGISYDESLKKKEFDRVHFGYNGYVQSTEVAISYKSLEYLANGIPIINSAKGDTYNLVEETGCGFNFNYTNIDSLVSKILSLDESDYARMRRKSVQVFEANFSFHIFEKKLSAALEQVVEI